MVRKICAIIITMALMLSLCMKFDWNEVKAESTMPQSDTQQTTVLAPTGFHGTSDKGIIKLKWQKNKDASGYILLKNGKKLKRLKAKKTSYIDKNVKLNKKYVYSIQSYKKVNNKNVKSDKNNKITVVATDKNSKKLNASRFVNVKSAYKIGFGETLKLNPKTKYSKKIKGKATKGKKLYSKKLRWSSSNSQLVSVSNKGKLTATSDKVTGTVKITVRSHNGIEKTINVSVVNFAKLEKVKNLKKVKDEFLKEILTSKKDATSTIAEYFQDNKPLIETELNFGSKPVQTEDGGTTYVDCIKMTNEMNIEDTMYSFILKYLLDNGSVTIKVTKDYICFQTKDLYTWGYQLNDLVYIFNNKTALDNYQYDNAVYELVEVADRWYCGTSNAYGLVL
ncbi:hypothetical protein [Eubacterium sp.]